MNMKFYKNILQGEIHDFTDVKVHTIQNNEVELFSSSSCLIPVGNKYYMNVRYVNYYIDANGYYLKCDQHIITKNRFFELNVSKNINIQNDLFMSFDFDNRRYIGIEDVRIFFDKYENNIKYIGTRLHDNYKIGMTYGIYNIETTDMKYIDLKHNFTATDCEKNWVFVDYKDSIKIIYKWHPLTICNIKDNTIELYEVKDTPKLFSRVRGSSCGFNYKNEIWFICHIASYEQPRHYYHIICVFDTDMNLIKYTAPFKFQGESIEYSLSIIVNDENVLINYSTWDRTTKIGVYDKKYIDSIVKYN